MNRKNKKEKYQCPGALVSTWGVFWSILKTNGTSLINGSQTICTNQFNNRSVFLLVFMHDPSFITTLKISDKFTYYLITKVYICKLFLHSKQRLNLHSVIALSRVGITHTRYLV